MLILSYISSKKRNGPGIFLNTVDLEDVDTVVHYLEKEEWTGNIFEYCGLGRRWYCRTSRPFVYLYLF